MLDYGCGGGAFLKVLSSNGFFPFGVEYGSDVAKHARDITACEVMSVEKFLALSPKPSFDVIYLGDVLEHLSNPIDSLNTILPFLKTGGILFVEGPLEDNPSLGYWASLVYGWLKYSLRSDLIMFHSPFHLFRTESKQQLAFFGRVSTSLELKHMNIFETGFPYSHGGYIKRFIANISIILSGKPFFGRTFGNRFQMIFTKNGDKI